MNYIYITVEKWSKVFELYKKLWSALGITAVRVDTMAEAIEVADEIEKAKTREIYFISIVKEHTPHFAGHLESLATKTVSPISSQLQTRTMTSTTKH